MRLTFTPGPPRRSALRAGLPLLAGLLVLPAGGSAMAADSWNGLLEGPFVQAGAGEKIDRNLQDLERMGFSGVALVMKGGLIVLHQAYGTKGRGGDSLDVRDLFPAGSFEDIVARVALAALEGTDPGSAVPASLRGEIERLAGEPYEPALRRLVLDPAGMRRARFATMGRETVDPPPAVGGTGPSRALRILGGSQLGRPFLPLFARGLRASAASLPRVAPAPGLLLAASDLYRWELALRRDDLFPEPAASWAVANTAGLRTSAGYEMALARDPSEGLFACILIDSDMGWGKPALAAIERGASGEAGQGSVFLLLLIAVAVIFLSIGTASQIRRRSRRERRSPIPF